MSVALLPKQQRELILELTVVGEPVPKARVQWKGRQSFTSGKVRAAEISIELQAHLQAKTPARSPIVVDLLFFMGNRRKVDWDNLAKLVCDSLNGVVWRDDSQIVDAHVGKYVDRARPRTEIRVWKINE